MLRISGWEEPNEMNHIIKWKKNISNDFIHILIKPHIFSQYNTFQVSRDFGGLIEKKGNCRSTSTLCNIYLSTVCILYVLDCTMGNGH